MVMPEDVLLIMAFLNVLTFAVAVTYKYRRNSILYDPMDEAFAHLLAVVMPVALIIAAEKFGKPMFAALGVGILAIMLIYYMFASSSSEGGK